jgi:CRP-like cAMP-binding protein
MDQAQLKSRFQKYFLDLSARELGSNGIDWSLLNLPIEVHSVEKGDYLFQQGDVVNRLYFLSVGLVRYVSVSDTGKEFTQTLVKGPRIIGSTRAMVTESNALFGIQALESSIILSYPWKAFYNKMREDKAFLECYSHFLERIFIAKEERESAFVKLSAERRYLDFCADFPELKSAIPQQYIASYLGITPVALSRIRKRLQTS